MLLHLSQVCVTMSACSSRVAWSVYTFSVLVICLQAVNAAADDDRVRMPVMKWAERVDKIFLTFMVIVISRELADAVKVVQQNPSSNMLYTR